jgi:hypothetical protein
MADRIFVPLIGQFDNIGDIILRRPLARWLRACGSLDVYVGPAPDGFVDGLGLRAEDRIYRSFGSWYSAGIAASGRSHYSFKPGEIQMSVTGLKEHVAMLPMLSVLRARGGRVVRVGSGARNFSVWARVAMMPSLVMSDLLRWRDPETARFMARGGVMPDLAFEEGDAESDWRSPEDRPLLVVSMRGDRGPVPPAWIEGMRAHATAAGLTLQVVTQVARDQARSRELGSRLGAPVLDWDGRDHVRQEARLREVYRRAAMAVSDRLHVLVSAFTHGAAPAALLVTPSGKIGRHFMAVGIQDVDVEAARLDAAGIAAALHNAAQRGPARLARLPNARAELLAVRDLTRSVLRGASAGPTIQEGEHR